MSRLPLQRRFELSLRDIVTCLALGLFYGGTIGWWVSPLAGALSGYLAFSMALIALIDLRHFTIPDSLSLPAIPLGITASVIAMPGEWNDVAWDRSLAVIVAGLALYLLRWAFFKLRGVIGLGLGDVKLGAAAGAWVGLLGLHWTLLLASVSALLAVALQSGMVGREAISPSTKVPFGSFIAPAIVVIWTFLLLGM
jgi:leader peptidase (prepilin peptidase) / N-methyltransferase